MRFKATYKKKRKMVEDRKFELSTEDKLEVMRRIAVEAFMLFILAGAIGVAVYSFI